MSSRVISAVLTLRDQNFTTNARRASNQVSDLERGVRSAGNRINQFGSTAVSSFANMAREAATTVGVLAGFAGLTTIAQSIHEVDQAFDNLAAKTGATGTQLEKLNGVTTEVFNKGFGESIADVSNGVATLESMFSDLNDGALSNVAEGAYTISSLWDAEVKEVGKTVKTMTKTFKGLSETDAMDLMTTAFQKTGDYSDDLLDTFNEYSLYFEKLGFDAKGFTNVLVKGAEAGAYTMDKAGDAIKEFGIRSIDASDATAEGFKAIGLDAELMTNNFAAGGETAQNAFAATVAGLAAMKDPVEQNAAGVALFGTQWEDLRETVILSMSDGQDAIGEFEGATKKAAETMQDNFGARMKKVWRELQTGIVEVFNENGGQEFLGAVATKAEEIIPKVIEGLQSTKGTAAEVFGFFKDNWGTLEPIIFGVVGGITAYKLAVTGAAAATNVWKGVTTTMTIAQALFNGTLAISPLGWVAIAIGAVIAVGILLWRNWDTVKAKGLELWESLKGVWSGITTGFSNMWSGVKSATGSAINYVISGLNRMITGLNNFASFKVPDWVPGIGGEGWEMSIPTIPQFALGTSYFKGGLAQINERGGEIVDLPNGSRVYPHDKSVQMARNEGPGNTNGSIEVVNLLRTIISLLKESQKPSVVIENIDAVDKSMNEILNELIPLLKKRIANM
ncbi:hypothetical protein LC040_06075 [Bacillus tianshenii]|nr:hypothetical protein LC040_06075 [Bacillus tianshenii]